VLVSQVGGRLAPYPFGWPAASSLRSKAKRNPNSANQHQRSPQLIPSVRLGILWYTRGRFFWRCWGVSPRRVLSSRKKAVPLLKRLFFKRFGGDAVKFQFVLVVLSVAAVAAEQTGMHTIVGAFLAGLAVNATLSRYSNVVGQVHWPRSLC
jgi:hypothetical protein